jgi:N-acetylneuraminic acid mutarotase
MTARDADERRRASFAVVAALAGLIVGGCVGRTVESPAPIDISAPGTWTVHASMPTARQEVAVATLDGRVIVIGGFGAGAETVATVELYDPTTDTWQALTPLPAPTHHAAAVVVNGRLFVIGGYTGGRVSWIPQQTVYEYDAARGSWATRAPMPTARGGLAVAALDGKIHAVGGAQKDATDAHEIYDPAADRWVRGRAMPTARDHLAAVAFGGKVWAIGGRTSFVGTQFANVEIYDPAGETWTPITPIPTGRGGLAAAALPDRVVVFGGEAPLRIFSATEMYETVGHRWIAMQPMRTPRHGTGTAVVGRRIYIPGGGTRPGYAPTNVNEAYNP